MRIAAMMDEPHYTITASVRHLQKLSIPPAKPWVAVKQSGTVVCAHCSCMAGLGEACLHITALLFTLEANTKMKNSTSCTSLPCSWLPPTFQNVPYAELSDTDFTTPNAKRRKEDSLVESASNYCGRTKVFKPTQEELDSLFTSLSAAGKPVILSITPGFSDSFVPLCMRGIIPKPLTTLYKPEYLRVVIPSTP